MTQKKLNKTSASDIFLYLALVALVIAYIAACGFVGFFVTGY